jgi:hypothetical protein
MASDAPPQATRFFVLKKLNEGQHDTEFSTVEPDVVGPTLSCPQCGGGVGTLSWQPPYRVELELYGKDFGDLVKGPGGDLLVTERFAEDFRADGLTGLSGFHPVEVTRVLRKRRGPKPGPPPAYFFVTPAYGPAALDLERSRLRRNKPRACTWCRSAGVDAIDGLALEAGTWTGEDIFRPRGLWGTIIVSDRFMRFAERHAMSHMALVPIDKYVWDPLGFYYPRPVQLQPTSKS